MMGEYATYRGESIKIGTCESMYYLRADQAHLVTAQRGSVDPVREREQIRFRFPFPDEDHLEPGCFENYGRGVRIPGNWTLPADYEHDGTVQFKAEPGYLLSIPCPEGPNVPEGLRVGKNGWSGGYEVTQQRWQDVDDGEWWTVVSCGSCGCKWRLPRDEAEAVAVSFRSEADRMEYRRSATNLGGDHEPAHGEKQRAFLHEIADRILAGYDMSDVDA